MSTDMKESPAAKAFLQNNFATTACSNLYAQACAMYVINYSNESDWPMFKIDLSDQCHN